MEHLTNELDKEKLQLIGEVLIKRGYKDWFLFFFKAIEKTDFIIEPVHNDLFSTFDDVINGKKNRLNINIFPRAGKTTLLVYFVAYCLAIQPKAQFIYTSFNQDLLRENANRLGTILKSKIYQDMYGTEVGFEDQEETAEDGFWQQYLSSENKEFKISARKITNKSGGIVVFNSIGSTITGFGFGLRNYDKFGGACLDYNEVIRTDKGDLKIGDIVEKKIQCKVLSYNLKTKQFEYKPIDNYIKNEDSKFLEIQLSNGSSIQCTPDHKFYINNQWKEAKDLNFYTDSIATFSNSFYLVKRQIKSIITIHNKPSYCLSIQDNHNMFIVKSNINYMGKYINQLILTHNCILDDANKPSDTFFYKKARQKTFDYFRHILLTRANNSKAPIINVQQRLHIDDLTGYLQREYNYYTLSIPLVNEDGTCNAPNQYTKERIEELKKDNYLFQTQYQQKPFTQGGQVIKTEWFKTYTTLPKFKAVYISADTAFMTKQASDYSVFQLWGKTEFANSDYYLIDMIRGKWESPELLQHLTDFYFKYKKKFTISQLYIENKASGIGLIQQIRRLKIPVKEVNPTKDKFKRLSDVLPLIESGYVYIPERAPWRLDFLNECEEFRRDMTHKHDDEIDAMTISLGIDVVKPLSIYNYLY